MDIKEFSFDATNNIIQASSSKGNQLKWFDGEFYIKADCLGYEGLVECLSSRIAIQTTLSEYGITEYNPCKINYNGIQYLGCYSPTFNSECADELSLLKIMRNYYNMDLKELYRYHREEYPFNFNFFEFARETIYCAYGYDISPWMAQLLKFDWLILNEDRHFGNILFLKKNEFAPTPLFDCGGGLLSDCISYPLYENTLIQIDNLKAKPFESSFKKQVEYLESKGYRKLSFLERKISVDVRDLAAIYPQEQFARAIKALEVQFERLYPEIEVNYNYDAKEESVPFEIYEER